MTAQKQGLKYERDLAAEIHEDTDEDVMVVFGGGTSGNVRFPQPDLLVIDSYDYTAIYGIEAKRTTSEVIYIDASDIQQLFDAVVDVAIPVLVVKFTHKEPLIAQIPDGEPDDIVDWVAAGIPDEFDPHITKGGNLRLTKPDHDVWPSAKAGRVDHVAVMEELGLNR